MAVDYTTETRRETEQIRKDKDALGRITAWKEVSREVAGRLVSRSVGGKRITKFNNQEIRQAIWQLKQVKVSIREIEKG